MDAKIDLILAAQDVQEADLKEMKDIKQLKVDVGILPKIQEQMKQFKTDIRAVKDDINTNKASILTLEARIDEITETNESLQKDLNQKRKPTTPDEPSLQDKIEEHIRRLGKKKQIIIEGIAENQLTQNDVQNDVNAIYKWCNKNKLTINVGKTKAQYFPRNSNVQT